MGEPASPNNVERKATRDLADRVVAAVRDDSSIAEALGFSRHVARYEAENIEPLIVDLAQEIELLAAQLKRCREERDQLLLQIPED